MQEARFDSLDGFRFGLARLLALHCAPGTGDALLARADAAIRDVEEVGVIRLIVKCRYCILFFWEGCVCVDQRHDTKK